MGIAHRALRSVFFVSVFLIATAPMTRSVSDAEALLKVKQSLNNATALATWNAGTDPCDKRNLWAGVVCINDVVTGLRLKGMGLYGNIDVEALSQISGLRTLTLVQNSFAGPIPEFNQIGPLKALYISKNQFSGEIPSDFFAGMKSMKKVWLSDNKFTGPIPSSLAGLPRIIEVHLENNRFSGKIPEFPQTTLASIQLSNNNLQGEIPVSLSRFNDSSFKGNPGLCGAKTGKPCKMLLQENSARSKNIDHIDSKSKKISFGIMAASVVILILMFFGIVILKRRQEKHEAEAAEEFDDAPSIGRRLRSKRSGGDTMSCSRRIGNSIRRVTGSARTGGAESNNNNNGMGDLIMVNDEKGEFGLPDLMKAAAEAIGNGTLSSSYKATMTNGTVVVVKRIKDMNRVGKDGFDVELRRLGGLRHKNILTPLGYHYRQEEKLLVYEFMPKGSLLYALHGDRGITHAELNWENRLKIIGGIAQGLGYLHEELTSYQVPHGDLQSNNILLTLDYEPLLSDFGYVSLINAADAGHSLMAFWSPEALQLKPVSPKTDVYCLGIVILEIVTGKFPSQYLNNGNGGTDVVEWVKSAVAEGREADVLDPEIADSDRALEQMRRILHIGEACAESNPDQRLELREAIRRIEEIQTTDDDDAGGGGGGGGVSEVMPSLRDGYADQIEEGRGVAAVRDGGEVR